MAELPGPAGPSRAVLAHLRKASGHYGGGSGLGGGSGALGRIGYAAEPGSTAPGELHATTVVPAAPPDSAVSLQDCLPGRIGAYGRFQGSIVHKILPQA